MRPRRGPAGHRSAGAALLSLAAALADGDVPEPVADDALARLREQGVVEVTVLVGYYRMLGGLLEVAGVPAPD